MVKINCRVFFIVIKPAIIKGCRELEEIRREWGGRAVKAVEIPLEEMKAWDEPLNCWVKLTVLNGT